MIRLPGYVVLLSVCCTTAVAEVTAYAGATLIDGTGRPAFFDLTDRVPYEEEVEWIKAHVPDTLRAVEIAREVQAESSSG